MNSSSLLYNFVFFLLGGLIVYAFRPFLGSYSAKKGENLATKEDIRELTKAAEEIKAKISDDVWDRQRQWELKRDAIITVICDAGLSRRALDLAITSKLLPSIIPQTDPEQVPQTDLDAFKKLGECRERFHRSLLVAQIIAKNEFIEHLKKIEKMLSQILSKGINSVLNSYSEYTRLTEDLDNEMNNAMNEARKELGIKDAGDLPGLDDSN